MSIQVRKRKGRAGKASKVYRVRWYGYDGRERNRTFLNEEDAKAFEAKITLAKRAGDLGQLDTGKELLIDFFQTWWDTYAEKNLERSTRIVYAYHWNEVLLPRLDDLRLRDVTPEVVDLLIADLRDDGAGEATILKALTVLQSMFRTAVQWGRVPINPVKAVRKPRAKRKRAIQVIPPSVVEAMRKWFLERDMSEDALLMSLLAYSGPRPQEVLALPWGNIRNKTILYEGAVAFGEHKEHKNRRPPRAVDLLGPLKQDLAEYRLSQGRPSDEALVFAKPGNGQYWLDHDYRNWRKRHFKVAAKACGVDGLRPYDLRHSFASLLLHDGRSVVEVAAQLGHSPTTTLKDYAHVIAELKGTSRRSPEAQIKSARAKSVKEEKAA